MTNPGQQMRIPGQMGMMGAASALLPQLPEWARGRAKDFFAYVVDFLPLGAGATLNGQTAIEADSDFAIVAGVRVITDTAAPPVVATGQILVNIRDAGVGRFLTSDPIHIDNLFGTAQLPAYWPYVKFIKRASTLTTTLQSLEVAARNVRIAYLGFKIFDWPED